MYRFSLLSIAILFFVAACGGGAEEPETVVDAAEPVNVIAAELMANKARFAETMSGLSQDQWTFQAAEDRWSLAMIAEHLIKAEESVMTALRDGVLASDPAEPQADPDSIDAMLVGLLSDRSQRFQAPDNLVPEGAYQTPDAAIEAFNEYRDATIAMAEDHADHLRHFAMEHPIGMVLDAHQWMLFVKAHADRHLAQAAEVKAAEGYPAS